MKPSPLSVRVSLLAATCAIVVALLAAPAGVSAQDVQVTAADPPAAEQGTVNLNVTIKGKGFKNGAQAKWFVTGTTNPGGVTVNSTTFISGSELQANITVADDAIISSFDIEVTNSNGRSGKGTELFAVVAKGSLNGSSVDACTNRAWTAASHSPIPNYCSASGAGCLDSTFGIGGVLFPGIAGNNAMTWAAAFQADPVTGTPRMLVGGQDASYQAVVARFGLDGQMDPTFGAGGVAVISPPTTSVSDYVRDMAVQADGKILAIWAPDVLPFQVARMDANGNLDTSFGTNGYAEVNNFGRCVRPTATAVAVQVDGKIIVVGSSVDCGWLLARLNQDGTLDSTFGNGGTVVYAPRVGKTGVQGLAVAIQNVAGEDRILVAGISSLNKKGTDFGLACFRSNGSLDTSFGPGGAGIVNTDFFGANDLPKAMAMDWAGRIVLAGRTTTDNSCNEAAQSAVARYTANGLPDTSFGDFNPSTGLRTGHTAANILSDSEGLNDLAIQPDGSIVGVGDPHEPFGTKKSYFGAIRWTPDGVLDVTFGDRGVALIDISPSSYARAMLLAPDGKVVVFGNSSNLGGTSPSAWAFARLLP